MKNLFTFFLRLFVCLLAAKFLLRVAGLNSRGYLLLLTALLTANVYWFDHLGWRDRFPFRRPQPAGSDPGPVADAPSALLEAQETTPPLTLPEA